MIDFEITNHGEIRFCCPFCTDPDTKYHLYVNIEKKIYNCFRCEASGKLRKLPKDIKKVLKSIDSSLTFSERHKKKDEIKLPEGFEILKVPTNYITKRYWNYLLGRGMSEESILKNKIGYCFGGEYGGRIIFPVYLKNELIGFEARTIIKSEKPKTFYEGRKDTFYNDEILMEEDRKSVIVTEGVFDAESVGRDKSLGVWGHSLTSGQYILLRKANLDEVVIFFDSDMVEVMYKVAEVLISFIPKIKIAILEKGDPGDWEDPLKKAKIREINNLMDLVKYKMEDV